MFMVFVSTCICEQINFLKHEDQQKQKQIFYKGIKPTSYLRNQPKQLGAWLKQTFECMQKATSVPLTVAPLYGMPNPQKIVVSVLKMTF